MTPYADPTRCVACRTTLGPEPQQCPACSLPLGHPLAVGLWQALSHADQLAQRWQAAATSPAPLHPVTPMPSIGPTPPARRRGLRSASVPSILLALGALCLLVAATIFMAVAWSWLGVEGRTTVLVALTGATGVAGTILGRRGLRAAGEALTAVAFGLLTLDVVGAESAGWLGSISEAALTCLTGGVVAAVALGVTLLRPRLVVPQVTAGLGLLAVSIAAADLSGLGLTVAAVSVLVFSLVALGAHRLDLTPLVGTALAGAAIAWTDLTLTALARVELAADPSLTVAGLWLEGPGWALAAATAALLVPALVLERRSLVAPGCAAAATLGTLTLVLPALDNGRTAATVAAMLAAALWSAAALALSREWSVAARVPAALAAFPVAVVSTDLLATAVRRVLSVGADLRLPDLPTAAHPAVLLPAAVVLLLVARAVLPGRSASVVTLAPSVLGVAAAATLALLPLQVGSVVATLTVTGTVQALVAVRRDGAAGMIGILAGVCWGVAAVAAAQPESALVVAGCAGLVATGLGVLLVGRSVRTDLVGGLLLPLAGAGLLWSLIETFTLSTDYRALPVLALVASVAIVRPRTEVEAAGAVAGATALVVAVAQAADPSIWLALHLTVAGALVSVAALIHPLRRHLGWAGGALLASATWVRLADIGVSAPEAYTLPTAVVLLLVGLNRLRHDEHASTAKALTPGLLLATVPSLLWVLAEDPVSLRAALLGVACVFLVLAGARLRWSTPLLIGATVGAVLTLRELAPYAEQTPQWLVIGLAGTLLTVVGVTWERRLVQLRSAGVYLGRLR